MFGLRRLANLSTKAAPPADAPEDPLTLAEPNAWLMAALGAIETAAGKPVTPETAMRVPAVSCAVRAIAETVGQIPFHAYRTSAAGARERASDHPAYGLIHDDASDWTSAAAFRTQLTTDALLHGDGVAWVGRAAGRPVELYRLKPGTFEIRESEIDGGPTYVVNEPSGRRVLPRADVLHIPAFSTDGVRGRAPIHMARESIATLYVFQEHVGRLFGRGARPAGTLTAPLGARIDAATLARIKAAWANYEGSGNSARTPLLEMGITWTPMALNSVDAQYLELWQFHVLEVARAFRVPPHMLFDLGRATWSNLEDMGREFLQFALLNWLKTWEAAYRRTLIAPEERGSVYVEALVDDLLRADFSTRAEGYAKLIAARVLNPNEARAMENRPPYEGGDEFANPNTSSSTASGAEPAEREAADA